ncbi:MAG TPA: hypothetical protein VF669_10835 [Tepidisphaeraceae bacterium]|jgi:hypothetical protein
MNDDLREKLVNLEPLGAAREAKLVKELEAMVEPQLSAREKWYWWASVAGSSAFVVMAALQLLLLKLDPLQKMIWSVFGIANVGMIVFLVRNLKRGRINVRHQFALGKVSVGVTLIIVMAVMAHAIARPSMESLAWALFAITWLMLSIGIALLNRVVAAEMNQKEQALRLEYRLAELSEKLDAR